MQNGYQNGYNNEYRAPALCANLCDLTTLTLNGSSDFYRVCELINKQAMYSDGYNHEFSGVSRIYVGSYFCDQFFLGLGDAFFRALDEFARACGIPATLVVPIFAQSTLERGISRIENLLQNYSDLFDEITVNDYGMASRMAPLCSEQNKGLNWGRLFMKEQRDPRYEETSFGCRCCSLDASRVARLKEDFPIRFIELDPFAPLIDVSPLAQSVPVALHLPHCFMSTGHICEAASATCTPEHSFRANAPCSLECCRSFSVSISKGISTGNTCYLIKSGRTVLFENPNCRVIGGDAPARIIWSPETFAFSLPEDMSYDYWEEYPWV